MNFDFPNDDLMFILQINKEEPTKEKMWKMYFDGVSNALGHDIGTILVSLKQDHYPFTARLNFDCLNNVVEYEAYIIGLQTTVEKKVKMLEVYGDSALVIYQLKEEWETRDSKLVP